MDLGLKNNVIIVTGGSRGIGKAVVTALLEEGAYVVTCARNEQKFEQLFAGIPERLHSNLLALAGDVLNDRQMQQIVKKALQKFGRLDGIVANAGSGSAGNVLDTPMQEWQDQFHMKVGSVLNIVKPAVPELMMSNNARIVIVNSVTVNVPEPDMAAVSASRAAVKQVAYMLAHALAPKINVNTVNIGVIDTDRQFAKYEKAGLPVTYAEWLEQEAHRRGIKCKVNMADSKITAKYTLVLQQA